MFHAQKGGGATPKKDGVNLYFGEALVAFNLLAQCPYIRIHFLFTRRHRIKITVMTFTYAKWNVKVKANHITITVHHQV